MQFACLGPGSSFAVADDDTILHGFVYRILRIYVSLIYIRPCWIFTITRSTCKTLAFGLQMLGSGLHRKCCVVHVRNAFTLSQSHHSCSQFLQTHAHTQNKKKSHAWRNVLNFFHCNLGKALFVLWRRPEH